LHVAFLAVDSPGSSVKGMIVLLLKHVHLQKDVAAGRTGLASVSGGSQGYSYRHIEQALSKLAKGKEVVVVASC
jgi:hypothetical protein